MGASPAPRNGAQAKHLLKNSDQSLRRSLELLDSTLIILSFGINEVFDRGYKREAYWVGLNHLLKTLRAPSRGSTLHTRSCLLTGPFAALKGGVEPPELNEVYTMQRELAARYRCAFWDTRDAMGGDMRAWQRSKLGRRDGVHLNRYGYRRIAELFEESLIMTWKMWRRTRREANKRRGLIAKRSRRETQAEVMKVTSSGERAKLEERAKLREVIEITDQLSSDQRERREAVQRITP